MKKNSERVCNSTISMGEEAKKHYFNDIIDDQNLDGVELDIDGDPVVKV